jgi:pyridoxamine 5'-phosphate oxidase
MTRAADPDLATLPEVLNAAWALLGRGVADRRHGFHHPCVATIDAENRPHGRIVILRGAHPATQTMRFHTDSRSDKCIDIAANPAISLTFYDTGDRIQLRVEGSARLHRDDAVAKAAWESSQRMSRACYATMPAPGSVLAERDAFSLPVEDAEIAAGYANFVAVVIAVERIEWLFLRHQGHRRARFDLKAGNAEWLSP